MRTNESERILGDARVRFFQIAFCTLLVLLLSAVLSAQNTDEYALLNGFSLPQGAIELSQLSLVDSIMVYQDKPFSGIAYERYPDRTLSQVISYKKGIKNGPFMVWYPDNKPQLYTNYRMAAPHGRFIGWYQSGAVLYNIVLNSGKLSGDVLFDEDEGRQTTETEVAEPEGTDND